ncbi:MAG: hypothetical protein V1790_17205 [Planctomycetota bacterium]
MENAGYNGLAGKARRARDLSRASRMLARQMIDEYLYPESDAWRPQRFIPIRGRSEFLPSAAFIREEPSTLTHRQLELPLTAGAVSPPSAIEAAPERTLPHRGVEASPGPTVATEPRTAAEQPRDSVIRPRRAPFRPIRRRKPSSPFTPGGFLFGCALGSAAAAVVLLVVQLAVR